MTLQKKVSTLPLGRRKKIARRTALLIAEEMTMREVRKARQDHPGRNGEKARG